MKFFLMYKGVNRYQNIFYLLIYIYINFSKFGSKESATVL